MREPRYPAARSVAPRLLAHFAQGAAPAGTPLPDLAAIEALVDAAFWASLQREEGYAPEISLAFLPPDEAVRPLRLAPPLPLGPRGLSQLSPAVERPGIHLGVWRSGEELVVWGTTRTVPPYCFVLEVVAPGLLVVKHRVREDSAKFRNVAVFHGEEVKILSREPAGATDHPPLLRPLLGPESADGGAETAAAARGVDARAQARRHPARGAGRKRLLARVDRAADRLRRRPALHRARRAAARDRRDRGSGQGRARAGRRRARRAHGRGRRDADHGPLRAAGVRRQDRASPRPAAGRARVRDASRSRAGARRSSRRCSSAAPGTSRPRSSPRTRRTPSPSWRRRTAASRCSPGREREGMVHAHRVEALLL